MKKRCKRARGASRERQGELDFTIKSWGGYREGAGRRKSKESGVAHDEKAEFRREWPVLVTMKIVKGLPELRGFQVHRLLKEIFRKAQRDDFAIVHYSTQNDHVHLIVEVEGRAALSRGMQGLAVRMARGLNRQWGLKGRLFADRYHEQILRTPSQVRNVLRYVLLNWAKHGVGWYPSGPDPFSSAVFFSGWTDRSILARVIGPASPIVPPRTFFLRSGWLRAGGPFSPNEIPGPKPRYARPTRCTKSA